MSGIGPTKPNMPSRSVASPAFLFGSLVLAAMCVSSAVAAPGGCDSYLGSDRSALRAGDEVWVIDTRRVYCPSAGELVGLRISQWEHRRWQPASLEAFLEGDRGALTLIWVHGNRVDSPLARSRGLDAYQALAGYASPEQQVRFVIWSWPTTRTRGLLRDVREKAARTGSEGYMLARVLDLIDPRTPVGLFGFSFGSRVITGSLHLLAGGSLGRYRLAEDRSGGPQSIRTVLMAAAVHDDWLLPGRYHGRALRRTESLFLMNNSCDRALQRYRFISPCSNPAALGYVGLPARGSLASLETEIAQRDVYREAGPDHTSNSYIYRPRLMLMVWDGLVE